MAEAPLRAHGAPGLCAVAALLVVAATLFNTILCFGKTAGAPIGLAIIQATELAIIGCALVMTLQIAARTLLPATVLIGLNIVALALIGGGMDFKIGIDLMVIAVFAQLGAAYATPANANRLLWMLAALTFAFGLYEMFALSSFEHYFRIYDYYVGKGALEAEHAGDTGTTLAENGVRPEDQGRQLAAGLLGLHRVGSVFLEPVSAGNFAVICIVWVFARRDWSLSGLGLAATGIGIGVLADARFSIMCGGAIALLLVTPLWRARLAMALMPLAMVAMLYVLGAVSSHEVDNSVIGRLTGSGQLLMSWSFWQWFGVASPRWISMDTGYSYVIGNLGICAAVLSWVACCLHAPRSGAAGRFFAGAAFYVSLSLCISASALSIKTGAVLWFLLGALLAENDQFSARITVHNVMSQAFRMPARRSMQRVTASAVTPHA